MTSISAIICTHNRARFLDRALSSLTAQSLCQNDYEVIVVDNASSDRTSEVVRAWQARVSNLRYIHEARLGLSSARNTGWAAASSPYVAFLDDDARASHDWLRSHLSIFDSAPVSPSCIAGRVLLDWGSGPPSWLPPRYYNVYSGNDLGEKNRILAGKEYGCVVGANMAFRRDVLESIGGFDPALGRKGGCLLSGEESAVIHRLRERGDQVWYAADAVVWHAVLQDRRRRVWLWRRMFWDGATQPMLDFGTGRDGRYYVHEAYRDVRRMTSAIYHAVNRSHESAAGTSTELLLRLLQLAGRLWTDLSLAGSCVMGRRTSALTGCERTSEQARQIGELPGFCRS